MKSIEHTLYAAQKEILQSRLSSFRKCNLQLNKQIAYYLDNKHNIHVTKDPTDKSSYILTDATCNWGQYTKVDVKLYDQKENLLAEIEIRNGRDEFTKDPNEFGEYCADAIAEVLFEQ
ncbi:MAG: hypothetical protein JSU72_05175 [Deltaproteobacteria bacterium]|nr:MAG: hypothetical protein JSU72_05175 [Deltaproteobacteria bacterium]